MMPIDPLPTPVPTRNDPANFAARGDAFLAALPTFAIQAEAARQQIEQADIDTAAAAVAAIGAANYRGDYHAGTTYQTGQSVTHGGFQWIAKQTTQGNDPPNATYWLRLPAIPDMTGQSGKFLTTNGSQPAWADVQALPVGGIGWFARDDLTFEWRGMKFVRSGAAVTPDLAPSWPPAVTDLPLLFQSAQLTTINTDVYQIETDRSGTWVAIDTSGNFRRSTNGGTTWASSGTTGAGAQGLATDRSGVWISAGNNNFRRSTNGGSSWSAILHSSGYLRCIATDRSGVWVAAGDSGAALRSTDNGSTWSAVTSGFSSSAIWGVATDCNGNWLMVGDSGKISRSTDNGSTWTALTAVGASKINSVATNESGVWVIGSSKTYRSTNIGTGWTEVYSGPPIEGIRHVTGSKWVGHGYPGAAVGYAIFYSSDAGVTWSYQSSITALAELYAVATDGSKYLITTRTGSSPYTFAVRSVEPDLVGIAEYTRHKYLRYD